MLLSNIYENNESNFPNDSWNNSRTSNRNVNEFGHKSISSKQQKKHNIETMHHLLNDCTDYSLAQIEPSNKFTGGTWINYLDFKKYFSHILFIYDPRKFKNVLNLDNNWIYNYDCFEVNHDYSIIYLSHDNYFEQYNQDRNFQSSTLLIFEPNNGENEKSNEVDYYINLDLVESSSGRKINETITLSNFYSITNLENLDIHKSYFLIMKSNLCPFGFNLKIISDFNIDNINYNTYLKKFGNYRFQKFTLEYSIIEKNKNYLLAKFSLKITINSKFKIIINHSDKMLKNYIEIFLIYGKASHKKRKIAFNNLDILTIDPLSDDMHYFVFLINPPYNIKEGSIDIEFVYSTENFVLEPIYYIEPYKITDSFSINKYGVIFKEIITVI